MRPIDLVRLVALAAIWGASFMFQRRIAAPLGPFAVASGRILVGGLALVAYLAARGRSPAWRRNGAHFVAIGLVNSAIPFTLFATAALYIPAAYSSLLNATAPVFGLAIGVAFLGERPGPSALLGVVLGFTGIALATQAGPVELTMARQLSLLACLAAAACYAVSGYYIKRRAAGIDPTEIAAASQIAGGLLLLPGVAIWPPAGPVDLEIAVWLAALGLVCSGLAYLLYFRLLADCGLANALSVTFLIPVFGIFWGWLVLDETVTETMLAGGALVVVGTSLIVRRPLPRPA